MEQVGYLRCFVCICKVLNKKKMLATVLDPRFKNLGFLNQNLRNKMYSNLEMVASEVEAAIQDQRSQSTQVPTKKKTVFEAVFGEGKVENSGEVKLAFDEVQNYINSNSMPVEIKFILEYWKQNASMFLRLAILAKKYLSIPATSVPSKGVFST
uniref:HAT C-terminal dimerisation domain-containing protein n=1 Tax=Romanomermis culicivorax TaxID=13658 RepID=A0A915HSL1_ROMCU